MKPESPKQGSPVFSMSANRTRRCRYRLHSSALGAVVIDVALNGVYHAVLAFFDDAYMISGYPP